MANEKLKSTTPKSPDVKPAQGEKKETKSELKDPEKAMEEAKKKIKEKKEKYQEKRGILLTTQEEFKERKEDIARARDAVSTMNNGYKNYATVWENGAIKIAQDQVDKSKKEISQSLAEEYDTEVESVKETGTLDALDAKKKEAVHIEIVRRSITHDSLSEETKDAAIDKLRGRDPNFDKLPKERQEEKIVEVSTHPQEIQENLKKYEEELKKAQGEGKITQEKIDEIAKKAFGLRTIDTPQRDALTLQVLKKWADNKENGTKLGEEIPMEIVERVLAEKSFQELATTLGDNLTLDSLPSNIREQILLKGILFNTGDIKLSESFREDLGIAKGELFSPPGEGEDKGVHLQKIQKITGINQQRMAEVSNRIQNSKKLSPLVKLIADICSMFAGILPLSPEQKAFWEKYRREQGLDGNNKTPYENYAESGGVGGGGDVNGTMEGYNFDVNGEITEKEQQTIKTITEAFNKQVGDKKMQERLQKVLERHAKNNPNFRADQPFLAHDVGTKQAFVYFPDGSVSVCPATHGYAGIGNKSGGGATSLGSKHLTEGWEGGSMKHRTIVKGLESCNANDEARLIRVHEWRGPGTKTEGCSGLQTEIAAKLKASVKKSGGGAQEVFNSNQIETDTEKSGKEAANNSNDLPVDIVKEYEGFYPKAYWDYDQWSVGYGTRGKPGEIIDKIQAEDRLRQELGTHAKNVDSLSKTYNIKLTTNERRALISFDYNTGKGGRILEVYSQGGKNAAAAKMKEFVKADGQVLDGLVKRRTQEVNIFMS